MGVHADCKTRRQGPPRRPDRPCAGGDHQALHHGSAGVEGRVDAADGRRPRRIHHRRGDGGRGERPGRKPQDHDDPVLAGQDSDHRLLRKTAAGADHDHPAAHHRHLLPGRGRRHFLHPRSVRSGQDGAAARDQPLRRSRRGDHRGVRRARRRSGGNPARVSRTGRPENRPAADQPLDHHLQYQFDAGGRARSVGIYRCDTGRILPPDGA